MGEEFPAPLAAISYLHPIVLTANSSQNLEPDLVPYYYGLLYIHQLEKAEWNGPRWFSGGEAEAEAFLFFLHGCVHLPCCPQMGL